MKNYHIEKSSVSLAVSLFLISWSHHQSLISEHQATDIHKFTIKSHLACQCLGQQIFPCAHKTQHRGGILLTSIFRQTSKYGRLLKWNEN